MGRWWRRVALVLGLLLLVLVLFLWLTPPGRTAYKTALFVPQVVPGIPLKPQKWAGPEVVREDVRIPLRSGEAAGNLYRIPDDRQHPAVLLFLGVAPAGQDDERVVNLGEALARSGMTTLVVWSQPMIEKRLDEEAIPLLVDAFQYLQGRDDVDAQRVGMSGFCVGGSFSLLAAADPEIRDEVAFVNFFGGYYDMRDLLVQVASRARFYDGDQRPWQPDSLTVEVFTTHLIEGLQSSQERELLEGLFLRGEEEPPGLLERLSPHGRVVYRLLKGVSLEEARRLVGQLPAEVQETLSRLSPRPVIDQVEAQVLIMHDREDNLVPSPESRRLADALESGGNVYYTEFSFFQHMDPTRRVGLGTYIRESWKLFLHMYNVISAGS
ncbi:MAG: dienelactone hydrolase family protein [Dehalococcoidia bacterium]